MVSKVAAEALKIADELKDKSLTSQSTFQNLDTLAVQQQLLKIYRDVLINDLEYALDQKVEQDLWTYGFKNYIVALQNVAKDKKDNWGEFQARLSWFLDCASGFYLTLLQEICSLFGLDLPFKRHDSLYGYRRVMSGAVDYNHSVTTTTPERSSCYYICQHCLVHLGDIARYRNQMLQAESFYRHAVGLGANSGQPYNQLALLEATRSDRLSTVFYYTRSIAVAHRFPAAATNLANTLRKSIHSSPSQPSQGSLDNKMSATDYEGCFLRLHALLYVAQDIPAANSALQAMSHALTPLIATHDFSTWKLVQMAVISIFTYTQVEEKKSEVRRVVSEFLIGYLNALLLPLYTMSGDNVLDYFSLPAIYVLMCWIKCESGVVEAVNRPHLWRGLCKLLNSLRSIHVVTPLACVNSALPEDNDLRGFLPLESALSSLNYGGEELSPDVVKKLRAFRIIKLGEWLTMYSDIKPIYISENGQFDATPVVNLVSPTNEHQSQQQQPQSAKVQQHIPSNAQECLKGRSRQNVALQSIFRRSQCQANEANADNNSWQVTKSPPDTRWWPQGSNTGDGVQVWSIANMDLANTSQEGTYSLFSGSPEIGTTTTATNSSITNTGNPPLAHQSLWSGPGPSPLERLLEQQKQLRHSSQFNT